MQQSTRHPGSKQGRAADFQVIDVDLAELTGRHVGNPLRDIGLQGS
jgi:hypothetical protein